MAYLVMNASPNEEPREAVEHSQRVGIAMGCVIELHFGPASTVVNYADDPVERGKELYELWMLAERSRLNAGRGG